MDPTKPSTDQQSSADAAGHHAHGVDRHVSKHEAPFVASHNTPNQQLAEKIRQIEMFIVSQRILRDREANKLADDPEKFKAFNAETDRQIDDYKKKLAAVTAGLTKG